MVASFQVYWKGLLASKTGDAAEGAAFFLGAFLTGAAATGAGA